MKYHIVFLSAVFLLSAGCSGNFHNTAHSTDKFKPSLKAGGVESAERTLVPKLGLGNEGGRWLGNEGGIGNEGKFRGFDSASFERRFEFICGICGILKILCTSRGNKKHCRQKNNMVFHQT